MTTSVSMTAALLLLSLCSGCDSLAAFRSGDASDGGDNARDLPAPTDTLVLEATRPDTVTVSGWQTVQTTTNPGKLNFAAAVYYPPRQTMLLYGGTDHTGNARGALWEFDGKRWTELCKHPCDNPGPGPRTEHAMSYDASTGLVLVFGGTLTPDAGDGLSTLWAHDGAAWSQRIDAPTKMRRIQMHFNPVREVNYVFGHNNYTDVYTYQSSTDSWNLETTSGPNPPRSRGTMALAYVLGGLAGAPTLTDRYIFCGGIDATSALHDDCWSWKPQGAWTVGCPKCTGIGREHAMMAFHRARGALVIVGGFVSGSGELAGTWEADALVRFKHVDAARPSKRDTAVMIYHPPTKSVWLYGGNGADCPQTGGPAAGHEYNCDDTLIYK